MKNIYLIPTDKGQRITKTSKGTLLWCSKSAEDFIEIRKGYLGFHLYVTSNEEIKVGDWIISTNELLIKSSKSYCANNEYGKKIILTTDSDLIENGIQSIDDEFLEWFVKNPSCEWVEYVGDNCYRELIIPQEKQIKCYCGHTTYCDCSPLDEAPNMDKQVLVKMWESAMPKLEPKQETTIEEAAFKLFPRLILDPYNPIEDDNKEYRDIWIAGAKWQAEIMYSEEDLREAYLSAIKTTGEGWNGEYAEGNDPNIEEKFSEGFTQWFEQFKKK
jgi:hypothetical protein